MPPASSSTASNDPLDLYFEHKHSAAFCRPVCDKPVPLHDHAAERVWRHLYFHRGGQD